MPSTGQLTAIQINKSITNDYTFEPIAIPQSEAEKKKEAELAKKAAEDKEKEKDREEAKKLAKRRSQRSLTEQQHDSDEEGKDVDETKEEEKQDAEKEDEEEPFEEEDDEYHYRVFFKEKEIEHATELQNQDLFEDLVRLKTDNAYQLAISNPNPTRFNITSFTPKQPQPEQPVKKAGKKVRRKTITMLDGIDLEDDEEDQLAQQ